MNQEEANALVAKYERTGGLPDGFEADHSSHTSVQENELEVVIIRQNGIAKISYDKENDKVLNIDLV